MQVELDLSFDMEVPDEDTLTVPQAKTFISEYNLEFDDFYLTNMTDVYIL